jgi:hypothetical protein
LPYVVNSDNNGNFELYSDYKLKEAVLNPDVCEILLKTAPEQTNCATSHKAMVSVCGFIDDEVYHKLFVFSKSEVNNNDKYKELNIAIKSIINSNNKENYQM